MPSFLTHNTRTALWVAVVLTSALALRVLLLAGPHTQLEADEAVVGLMARHVVQGERPLVYWGQHYMGSLEAYLAAVPIALFGSGALALKLAPLAVGLVFVALVFATGYRVGGLPTAVVSGLYVAVGPAFLDLWSLKARGGYIEVMAIGQGLLLLAFEAAKRRSIGPGRGGLIGLLAGVGLWTNTLIGVYLLPIALYLALCLRGRVVGWWLPAAVAGALIGAAPLVQHNLQSGFATLGAMFTADEPLRDPFDALDRLLRYSLPVLAGFAQGSSSWDLFGPAYFAGLGARRPVLLALALLLALLVASRTRGLLRALLGREGREDPKNLLALVLVTVPLLFIFSKFREQVMEPRYLLPLYSAGPVLAAYWAARPAWSRVAVPAFVAGFLALNLYSISALDVRLNLPESAASSTPQNRAELIVHLTSKGMDRIYTDYWLGYPLAFESDERIVPSVLSGGYNRFVPYAHAVSVAPNPAFVFVAGSKEEQAVLRRWAERGVWAKRDEVSVYAVYYDASPLDAARP